MKGPMARASARPAARRFRHWPVVSRERANPGYMAMEERWIPDQVRDDDLSDIAQFVT